MRRSSRNRQRTASFVAVAAASAIVLAGCGGNSSSSGTTNNAGGRPLRDHRDHDGHGRPLRHLRLQGGGSLGRLPQALPQHHDQGGRRRAVGRLLDASQDAPRGRQRPRRRPGHRDRLRRRRRAEPRRPVRELEHGAQRRRRQGGVLPLEVAAGDHRRRQHDGRARHRHRPGGDLLPQRPAQAGRPAVRPPDPRQEVDHVGRLHQLRQAVRGVGHQAEPAPTSSTRAASVFSTAVYQGNEAYDNADGQPDVQNSDGVQNAWKYATAGGPGRHHRRALQQFTTPVEQGVLQRRVRGARLPDLDDGLHPGPGR